MITKPIKAVKDFKKEWKVRQVITLSGNLVLLISTFKHISGPVISVAAVGLQVHDTIHHNMHTDLTCQLLTKHVRRATALVVNTLHAKALAKLPEVLELAAVKYNLNINELKSRLIGE